MANGSNWSSRKNAYYRQQRALQKQRNQVGQQSAQQSSSSSSSALNSQYQQQNKKRGSNAGSLDADYSPGYNDNNNPNLVKWQGQNDDDKAARYLARVHHTDLSQYDDNGYPFYDSDFQRFTLAQGLNAKPQVIPDAQFDQMVAQNNLQVLYRGESGQAACDRFMFADNSHTGTGSYGDGFYFSEDVQTANGYAFQKGGSNGRVIKMALSPTAKAITWTQLRQEMAKAGIPLQNALRKQGTSAPMAKYHNSGEAQFALKLGYNVITDCQFYGSEYHFVLTRDAVIVSDKVKHRW